MFLRNSSLFSEDTFQSAAVAVLIDKVEIVGCLEHVYVFDDVFVFFNIGEDIDFVNRALLQLLVFLEAPYLDHFHRVFLVIVFVDSPIDLPVSPLTDNFVERIVFDDSYHVINVKYYIMK